MNRIQQLALTYLGYTNQTLTNELQSLLAECEKEVQTIARPKVYWQKYALKHPLEIETLAISIPSIQLEKALKDCEECIVIAVTLGGIIDQRIKYYTSFDMHKGVVFDAIASAYLEVYCDIYEEEHLPSNRGYRYAPGYSDIPLFLNSEFVSKMNLYKYLGISMYHETMFTPMKTLLGIMGLGVLRKEKSCEGCKQYEDCEYRRRNQTCY